jgi:8-oxo-dGTP pyrophosphatase MutT (NUDIX family)
MERSNRDPPRLQPWPQVSEQTLARYALFELQRVARRSPTTGSEHSFLRLVAPDWVNVVAITEDRRMILVEQYRHGTNRVTVEIPGGAVDEGEGPAAAAARELEEETGYRADDLVHIGMVHPNPAFLTNSCWTFLALGCRPVGEICPDASEEIAVRLVEPAAFTRLIDERVIEHALVIAAHDHLQRGIRRREWWADRLPAPQPDEPSGVE